MQEFKVLYISNVLKTQIYSSAYIYSIFNTLLKNSSSRILQILSPTLLYQPVPQYLICSKQTGT